jgi:toxin HigB-1
MIDRFRDPASRQCFEGERVHGVGWEQIQKVARRKLLMVMGATRLNDLRSPPNNRLEELKEDRAGQHSIRVNDQWRVCFVWTDQGATQIEVTDYH